MKIGQSIPGLLADMRGMTISRIREAVETMPREDDEHMLYRVTSVTEKLRYWERKVMKLEHDLSRIVDTM